MTSRILSVGAALLLVAGMVVGGWPWMKGEWTAHRMERSADSWHAESTDLGDARLRELHALMVSRNVELAGDEHGQDGLYDPFGFAKPDLSVAEFGLPDDIVGSIEIPSIDVTLPVRLGASHERLLTGAAHLTHTSYPVGGASTNSVIAAHRDFGYFMDLDQLAVGDDLTVRNYLEPLAYRVVETRVIDPDATEDLLIQPGRDLVTLITCHPKGANGQRLIVIAERT